MGADLKRKQARKKKFEGQNCDSPSDVGVQLDFEGTALDHPPKKKSKQTVQPLIAHSENTTTAEEVTAGKVAVVDGSMSCDREEPASTAVNKAQRFIVFIGPCNLLKLLLSVD